MKRKSSYIFTFGNVGVGKSTILATLASYLQTSDRVLFRMNISNKEGTRLLIKDWLPAISSGDFPPTTRKGGIWEIDLGFEAIENPEIKKGFTFLEVSGEDLREIDLAHYKGEFPQKIEDFLKLADIFIVVVACNSVKEDDYLVAQFFETLLKHNISKPVALVISKWDLVDSQYGTAADFVNYSMPLTRQWMSSTHVLNPAVFSFSVGVVDNTTSDKAKILELDFSDTESLAEWLYQTLP
jgi:GTPase SAR1 family protein